MNKIKGSAILIVVMVLMFVSTLTAITVRTSMTSLNQSAFGQAQRLLENENDVAMRFIFGEKATAAMKAATGIFGFTKAKTDNEVVWCMPAKISTPATFFVSTKTSQVKWTTGASPTVSGGATGFCKSNTASYNTSVRQNVITQIALYKEPTKTASTVSGGALTTGDVYTATVTSFLPKMTSATAANMDACLNTKVNNLTYIPSSVGTAATRVTVGQCLKKLGVPVHTTTATYVVQ